MTQFRIKSLYFLYVWSQIGKKLIYFIIHDSDFNESGTLAKNRPVFRFLIKSVYRNKKTPFPVSVKPRAV